MLKYRILVAVILIPLLIWAIWSLPVLGFAILGASLIAIAAWEWAGLIGFSYVFFRGLYVLAILIGLFLVNWMPAIIFLLIGFLSLLWAFFAIVAYQNQRLPYGFQIPVIRILLGFCVFISFWVGLITLKVHLAVGSMGLIYLLCVVWSTDTGAYIVGHIWGKHKLITRVSPNKTWEGFWGGLLLGMIVALVGSLLLPINMQQRFFVCMLAIIAMFFSVVGDLMISLLKRLRGKKDSGRLFPGHGGMLDRMDSIIAAVIVFALGGLLFGL